MSFLGESTIFFTLFDALDLRESNIIGADTEYFTFVMRIGTQLAVTRV
jgi:hypothetical protein